MKYLLDTDTVGGMRRGRPAGFAAWVSTRAVSEFAISVITVLEHDLGIRRVERRDPPAGAALRAWLDRQLAITYLGRVLPVDGDVALAAGSFHFPEPMPLADSLIAATAAVHGLTLVTRNATGLARSGVPLLDPWSL